MNLKWNQVKWNENENEKSKICSESKSDRERERKIKRDKKKEMNKKRTNTKNMKIKPIRFACQFDFHPDWEHKTKVADRLIIDIDNFIAIVIQIFSHVTKQNKRFESKSIACTT